ncbi:hypothetical protein NPIL_365701 [Nephila pilipes]|uniref:Uncharacterized protein n=1 Tax=Nephila pilipes TaxID=299642 RepID=A0A8X6TZU3_NEPPI|nr:hypothetical protein NPIL_365701 [Nephila pilipes]
MAAGDLSSAGSWPLHLIVVERRRAKASLTVKGTEIFWQTARRSPEIASFFGTVPNIRLLFRFPIHSAGAEKEREIHAFFYLFYGYGIFLFPFVFFGLISCFQGPAEDLQGWI